MDSLTALDGSQTSAPSFEDCSSFAPSSAALQGSDRAVERGGGGREGKYTMGTGRCGLQLTRIISLISSGLFCSCDII